jgi:hypothetical protein
MHDEQLERDHRREQANIDALSAYIRDRVPGAEVAEARGSGLGIEPRIIHIKSRSHKCSLEVDLEPLRDYDWPQLRSRLESQTLIDKVTSHTRLRIFGQGGSVTLRAEQ